MTCIESPDHLPRDLSNLRAWLQTNLKHEDSYIYLAAINGLCALATAFPQEIIETLVPEYIDMPSRITGAEVTIETRVKLGEILVKTTRALGT